jgi:PKD repeat protein
MGVTMKTKRCQFAVLAIIITASLLAFSAAAEAKSLNGRGTAAAPPSPPVANFTLNPTSGTAALTVQFTNTSTGTIITTQWDFGDGASDTSTNPSHTYTKAGTFNAKLTVSNSSGSSSKTASVIVTAPAPVVPAPVANFTLSASNGTAPLTVQFTDTSTGTVVSRLWNFGDGSTDATQNPSHTFKTAGTFNVKLTVSNSSGSSSKIVSVIVTAPISQPPSGSAGPLVTLFVPWNDLARDLNQIEQIPTNKFSGVTLSFNFPARCGLHGTHIQEAISRLHARGLKVIIFLGMEANVAAWNTEATNRRCYICDEPDEFPHDFDPVIQPDGTIFLKGGSYPITTFLDSEFRTFMTKKINMLSTFGADYMNMGEDGYTMGRSVTADFLNQFVAATGTYLPTTTPGATLNNYLNANPSAATKIWDYRWKCLFDWLTSTAKMSGHARWNKTIPLLPGAKIADYVGTFDASDAPTSTTYTNVLNQINSYRVTGLLNIGQIQFAVGNTGALTPYPNDIYNRAMFLWKNGVDSIEFYGSSKWTSYKNLVQYLPDLTAYPAR